MNPEYPIYIVSKGRWESRLTAKALERMNVPYHIVIEPQEYNQYASVIDSSKILVLPFSNLGQGSIPARNWIWEHSIGIGAKRHWILDDNLRYFFRFQNNNHYEFTSGVGFKIIENFVGRYLNIALAGMQYKMFAPKKGRNQKPAKDGQGNRYLPFVLNTRIYSCILIKNDIPYRWRGRYNEDTDLSLRVLKDGWCTVLFYAFLADKIATMQMKGGNTDQLYKADGRYQMALSLYRQHPDVTKITYKWGRYQHLVDYSRFKSNRLLRDLTVPIPKGIDNYGMILSESDKV